MSITWGLTRGRGSGFDIGPHADALPRFDCRRDESSLAGLGDVLAPLAWARAANGTRDASSVVRSRNQLRAAQILRDLNPRACPAEPGSSDGLLHTQLNADRCASRAFLVRSSVSRICARPYPHLGGMPHASVGACRESLEVVARLPSSGRLVMSVDGLCWSLRRLGPPLAPSPLRPRCVRWRWVSAARRESTVRCSPFTEEGR
jgi:hypothetical protein